MENVKKIVVYYSYTGHTKMIAESIIKQIHYLVLADKKEDRGVYRRIPVYKFKVGQIS